MSAWHTRVCEYLLMSRSNYYYYPSRSHHDDGEKEKEEEEKNNVDLRFGDEKKKKTTNSFITRDEWNSTTGTEHCDFKWDAILRSQHNRIMCGAWCFGICFLIFFFFFIIIPFFIRLEINLLNVPTIWFLSLAVVQWNGSIAEWKIGAVVSAIMCVCVCVRLFRLIIIRW